MGDRAVEQARRADNRARLARDTAAYFERLTPEAPQRGIATGVDAATGQMVFSASPVAAEGKVYLVNEDGEVFVLQVGAGSSYLKGHFITTLKKARLQERQPRPLSAISVGYSVQLCHQMVRRGPGRSAFSPSTS